MNMCEGLGFKHLSHHEQQTYKVILKALSLMSESIDCSQLNRNVDVMKIIQTVLGDNPSIIYFNKTKIEVEVSALGKWIILTVVHSKAQTEKMMKALDTKATKIITTVKASSKDEYSLLINLYSAFQRNVRYDKEEVQANSKGICNSPSSHNAYGALINRVAVCDGFSSAFAFLTKKLGFDCMLVVGRSAYSSTGFTNHAWNIIKVQSKFYHMDITWDTRRYNEFGEYSHVYFAMKDEEIAYDHTWDKNTAPSCSYNDLSYYIRNSLYANTTDQLNEIIKAYAKKQTNVFQVKLSRNISLPKNAGEYLTQRIVNESAIFEGHIKFIYGWNENTRCFYAKI